MKRMKFIQYINAEETYGEMALVNAKTNEIVLKGDALHDKISVAITFFLNGLEYAMQAYEVETKIINKEECENLPFDLDFYYENNVEDNNEIGQNL